MFSIGIDSGSVATKGVLYNGEIKNMVMLPTGWSPKSTAKKVLEQLLKEANINREEVKRITGTGYGRISMDFADQVVTEITCHGKGAYYLNPYTRTILDIGGQDSKVIELNENGKVIDFLMNDKCAAGTGRFLQVMAHLLEQEINELDDLAMDQKPQSITSMCTVFAESEVVSLLAKGASKGSVARGILESIANRAIALLGKIKVKDGIVFTGGVAQSKVLKSILEKKLKKNIYVDDHTQMVGALGAAIIGYNKIKKRKL